MEHGVWRTDDLFDLQELVYYKHETDRLLNQLTLLYWLSLYKYVDHESKRRRVILDGASVGVKQTNVDD